MMPKAKKIFRPVISLLVVLCLSLGLAALDPLLGQRAESDLHLVRLAPALMGEFDASILEPHVKSADAGKVSSVKPEIDSSPKTYTLREQIVSGLKLATVASIIFMALWFFEKL